MENLMPLQIDQQPRFIQFLAEIADAMKDNAFGLTIEYEAIQVRPRTETSNGLLGLRVVMTDEEGEAETAMLYANGTFKNKNMVKLEIEGRDGFVGCCSNPHSILAIIWFGGTN